MPPTIAVIGLGYVGLPLAIALARHFPMIGIDTDKGRIAELAAHRDRTNEVEPEALAASTICFAADIECARGADIFIVTVPTPVDAAKVPDLGAVIGASRSIASVLEPGQGTIIVYESTVYPGVTEEICATVLEEDSGLVRGRDFFLGYSPERINPGDREHTVDRIVKVVAGENPAVLDRLAAVYGAITTGGVFRAASIKVAEAAKVIENAQRDINIAFVNEITRIFAKMDLSVWDVLEAAGTKWNFLPFKPGLVGGHCIGVDPYYLSHRARELGHDPQVILAGRAINDGMSGWIAEEIDRRAPRGASVLILGLTFKENVPDLRNSRVAEVATDLAGRGHLVTLHDPHADPAEAAHEYGLALSGDALDHRYDVVFAAVPHDAYQDLGADRVAALVRPGGLLADLKGMWRDSVLREDLRYWTL